MKYNLFLLLLCTLMTTACHKSQDVTQQHSPDGSIHAELTLDSLGSPGISIRAHDQQLLTVSHIGLLSADGMNLSDGFSIVSAEEIQDQGEETLPWGERKTIFHSSRGFHILLKNSDSVEMQLQCLVADDGVAFRYCYNNIDTTLLLGESTTYLFASDGQSWSIPANFESYEFEYRQQPISQTVDANTPFTFHLHEGCYGSIHEAALVEMPEMTLVRDSINMLLFHTWLCPDNSGSGTVAEYVPQRWTSWRAVTIGSKAVDLINSDFLLSLNLRNPHSKDTFSYAKPIRYIGVWWGMHLGINSWIPDSRHGATTDNALRYIDFAADNDIDAVLFEGWNLGWDQWGSKQEFDFVQAAPDFDLERVISHARERGVQIIMHHETGGNIPHYEAQMEQAFQWCQDHGIHYVKTGYAGGFPDRELHHSQYGVTHYAKVVASARRHDISLIVHEPIKPTGLRAVSPNLMSAEGARGMEWNAWSDGNTPAHTTILPFTRLLAGPMDYTPGIFDITYERIRNNPLCKQWNMKDSRQCRVHTTLAKQVALWVVLYSPVVMAADLIENYEGHPMFQFFRHYNPDCDWSQALQGEPGEYVALVRRSGDSYYLGAITNEEPRTLHIPLDFLPEGVPFEATLYGDAEEADYLVNPTAYHISRQRVTRKDTLTLKLAAGGGCAATIKPLQ